MNPELEALLALRRGVVRRVEARQVVTGRTIEHALRSGRLSAVLPGVYAAAELRDDADVLQRAAAIYADRRGALSHTTALAVWGLREQPAGEPVHVTVARGVRLRTRSGLVVHHRHGFAARPPHVRYRRGLPVTGLERSLVEAWPLLPAQEQRMPLIRAVSERRTTVERIAAAVAAVPRLGGRAELGALVDRLAAGCRSPLEIWGHDHVFAGPGMPHFERQARVCVAGHTMYLDVFAQVEQVDFELDGNAWHTLPAQREADLRRDARLASIGIVVVRYTHDRLVSEPGAVRHEVLAILTARRRPAAR